MKRERIKSTIAVILIGAILLLAGYVEVNAVPKQDTRTDSNGKTQLCYTDCVGSVCQTYCY